MRFLFFLIKKFVSPLFIPVIGKNYHFIHCFHSLIFFFESDKCFSWLKMRVSVTWCHCCRQHCYLKTQLLKMTIVVRLWKPNYDFSCLGYYSCVGFVFIFSMKLHYNCYENRILIRIVDINICDILYEK